MKKALITGVTGQDGALLAELLLGKGYAVHGVVRRASLPNTARIAHLLKNPNLHLHYADVVDAAGMMVLAMQVQPQEIYNLAAQSDVHVSFTMPGYTLDANAKGTLSMLEALRALPKGSCKFYQASTSEIYGNTEGKRNEQTPFQPCSPYGVSKLCAYWMVVNYREAYGLFAANGILFNHESPLRGERFVSRKITRAVAKWAKGGTEPVMLGNLNAQRDWGHARDYVQGIWAILQHEVADDFVLATGEMHSVREFAVMAFAEIGRTVVWQGEGVDERGVDAKTGEWLVGLDAAFFRPLDIHALCGDTAKAQEKLGWKPKIAFAELVKEMVAADVAALGNA
jgi:GDPmannose 4,6-dehydratase